MQNICKYICKIEGCRSLVGNVIELDAVCRQFQLYIITGYSLCIYFGKI